MANERKLICGCGGAFQPCKTDFQSFKADAMRCGKCGYVTLTKDQALAYSRLKDMHDIVDSERKIIQIGNSLGMTLPEKLRSHGVRAGGRVRLEATGPRSFSVEIL
jgi:hypothetical protein